MRSERGRSHSWAHAGVLAWVCLAAACAAHQPRSLSDRFVRQATPADIAQDVDLGPEVPVGRAPALHMPAPRTTTSDLPIIEREDAALAAALEDLHDDPSPDHYRRVGAEYRRLNVFDDAHTHLHHALKLKPRDAATYEELARLWRDHGLPEIALGDAHRAVSFAPESAGAHNTLGTVLYALGNLDAAEREFSKALRIEPAAAWAHSNLCYVAFLRGNIERARHECHAALAIAPALRAAQNNLGLVEAAAGDLDAAQDAFVAGGGLAVGLYNTGIVQLARGDYAAAVEAFDAALDENPGMMDALRRAAEARALAARAGVPLSVRKQP